MKNVLITGAGGFFGRNLAICLADNGIRTYAVVRPGNTERIPKHSLIVPVEDNLEAPDIMTDLMRSNEVDTVYHLAWDWHGEKSKDYRIQCSNIDRCINVLEACRNSGCSHVIISGSASEFAYSGRIIDGSGEFAPGDAYAAAKAAAHIASAGFARENGINLNWLLIGGVYGPGRTDGNIISHTIESILRGERSSYTGLEQQWDFLFIDDLVKALYLVGEKGRNGATYPVGSGNHDRMSEYIRVIYDVMETDIRPGIGEIPYKGGMKPDNSVIDISRLSEDTGYRPAVSFEEGIKLTVEWFRERHH